MSANFLSRTDEAWDAYHGKFVDAGSDQVDAVLRLSHDFGELAVRLGRLTHTPTSPNLRDRVRSQCVRVANWARAIDEGIEKAEGGE